MLPGIHLGMKMNYAELVGLSSRLNGEMNRGVTDINRLLNVINNFEERYNFNIQQFGLFCAVNGFYDIMEVLVERDLDIYARHEGRTLLSYAAENVNRLTPSPLIDVTVVDNNFMDNPFEHCMENRENILNYRQ